MHFRTSSALAPKGEIKGLLDSVPDVEALFAKKSTAEVQAILESYLDPSGGTMEAASVGAPSGVDEAIRELSA